MIIKNKISTIVLIILLVGVVSSLTINLENTKLERNEQVKESDVDNGKKFEFSSGGTLQGNYQGESFSYSNLQSVNYGGVSKQPEIVFDLKGEMSEAYFKTGSEGEYLVGNEKVPLPSGSEVVFRNGEAQIKLPANTKVKETKVVGNTREGKTVFAYESADKKITFENGYTFQNDVLKYNKGNFFFEGNPVLNEVMVSNPEKVKTYLDFKGEVSGVYDSPYVSMNRERGVLVTGSNIDVRGPGVGFGANNPFGVRILQGDHFAVQSLGNPEGAFVMTENRNRITRTAKMTTLNQYVLNENGGSQYYHSINQKLYFRPRSNIIRGFQGGSSTTPVEIWNYKKVAGGKMELVSKYDNKLLFGDDGEVAYGSNPTFVTSFTTWGVRRHGHFKKGVSNSWLYYGMKTEKDFERFFNNRINLIDTSGITRDPRQLRVLTDIVAGAPPQTIKAIKRIYLEGSAWYAGLASPGRFHLNVGRRGYISPGVARHEMAHVLDFTYSYRGGFNREWHSIGGHTGPHTYRYGYTGAEDTSTFAEYVYKSDATWKRWMNPNYQYYKKFRGRVAVFMRWGFITHNEGARILSTGGWKSDSESLKQYIREAGGVVVG